MQTFCLRLDRYPEWKTVGLTSDLAKCPKQCDCFFFFVPESSCIPHTGRGPGEGVPPVFISGTALHFYPEPFEPYQPA